MNDQFVFGSKLQIPLALQTLLATRCQQITNLRAPHATIQDFEANLHSLRNFVLNLKYIYFNNGMMSRGEYVPAMYEKATTALKIAILTALTFDKLAVFTTSQF